MDSLEVLKNEVEFGRGVMRDTWSSAAETVGTRTQIAGCRTKVIFEGKIIQ